MSWSSVSGTICRLHRDCQHLGLAGTIGPLLGGVRGARGMPVVLASILFLVVGSAVVARYVPEPRKQEGFRTLNKDCRTHGVVTRRRVVSDAQLPQASGEGASFQRHRYRPNSKQPRESAV
jgi:hypothetical protein